MEPQEPDEERPRKRQATLYDAVAGHVGYEGFLRDPATSRYRDTKDTSNVAVPPEEVLFRRKNAPERFAEDDLYRADRHLTASQQLPDSDLLKSIHVYASHYYSKTTTDHGKRDFRSMDETALLAMAILLEEAAAHALGETGDLAFARAPDEPEMSRPVLQKVPATRGFSQQPTASSSRPRQRRPPPSAQTEPPSDAST